MGSKLLPIAMLKLIAVLPAIEGAVFNWTTCPSLHEVQASHLATDFKMEDYVGYYYELAFHDILQAFCPSVTCVNTNKTLRAFPNGQKYINEAWGLHCLGKSYPQTLLN